MKTVIFVIKTMHFGNRDDRLYQNYYMISLIPNKYREILKTV